MRAALSSAFRWHLENLAELLDASMLASAKEAAGAIRAGWTPGTPLEIGETLELLETYSIRLEHIRKKPGAHAAQLAISTAELVEELAKARDVKIIQISGPAEHDFLVYLADGGARVIGCLRTISALRVTPDRWDELWRGAP